MARARKISRPGVMLLLFAVLFSVGWAVVKVHLMPAGRFEGGFPILTEIQASILPRGHARKLQGIEALRRAAERGDDLGAGRVGGRHDAKPVA